jgi:hypothetical protein
MTAFFLVLWNRGGRLALFLNKKDSGEHPFFKKNPGQHAPTGMS